MNPSDNDADDKVSSSKLSNAKKSASPLVKRKVKKSGSFQGKSNILGQGGRATVGQKNYH